MQNLCQKNIDMLQTLANEDVLPCAIQETIHRNTIETFLRGKKDGNSIVRPSHVESETRDERLAYWKTRLREITDNRIVPSRTTMFLNKFEKTNILSHRAMQLASGASPLCDVSSNATNLEIAEEELRQNVLDCQLRRYLPDGSSDLVCVQALRKDI